MFEEEIKHKKRIRFLAIMFALLAVILTASTYAWFIGLRTVHVSPFDVEIAGTDSLMLSLDGETWSDTIDINSKNYNDTDVVYDDHTNWWAGKGLIPMSSVGIVDPAGKLTLYEKASLTATPGGYRLMASRVNNFGTDDTTPDKVVSEKNGYVAFDLFVKNFSGSQYLPDPNIADEEAIYLTFDSKVDVSLGGVQNTGIENSVRVGFAQIGRVIGTEEDAPTITGITCTTDSNVTGICSRPAQIWEPNDEDHVTGAINWYKTACRVRNAADLTLRASYDVDRNEDCGEVVDGTAVPTYAVNKEIKSEHRVDVYDGEEFNTYTATSTAPNDYLAVYPTFTDTMKDLEGTARPAFMYLAPNSITKVRIYIWIEGQDIDNYDFASIGKSVSIKFGFTKERFEEDSAGYPNDAPSLRPEITLNGPDAITLNYGEAYTEEGATAIYTATDGTEYSVPVSIMGKVNSNVPGTYYITYKTSGTDTLMETKVRTVVVKSQTP